MTKDIWTRAATALAVALFLLTLGARNASADIAQYSLTWGNSDISSFTGPYGTIDVNRTSTTTAVITFNAASGFKLGDGGPGQQGIGVNVNAGSWTVSGWVPGIYTNSGAGGLDGAGSFNQTFYRNGGFPQSVYTFSFNVTASGANWRPCRMSWLRIRMVRAGILLLRHTSSYAMLAVPPQLQPDLLVEHLSPTVG